MTRREELEAALARAEANLGNAIFETTKADADLIDANAIIEKARAHCRQVHAALTKLGVPNQ